MNIKDNAIRKQMTEAIEDWAVGIVDSFAKGNPKLQAVGVYLKNGVRNYIRREADEIEEMIDNAALFVADHDGNVDMNKLYCDGMQVLKEMDETDFSLGIVGGTIGGGTIKIHLPDNMLIRALFGDHRCIVIGESDFKELKEYLVG
jgi:hypothetical protein